MKTCSICNIKKKLSEFNKCKERKDGLKSICRECQSVSRKQYHQLNKQAAQQYYIEKKDIIDKRNKEYQAINKEKISTRMKKYYKGIKGIRVLTSKIYRQSEAGKISSDKSVAKRRAFKAGVNYESFRNEDVLERDGYICQHCKKKTRPYYKNRNHPLYPNLDHIIPLSRGGEHTKKNTQCLCHQCNMKKSNKNICDQLRLLG